MNVQVRMGEPFWRTVGVKEVTLEVAAPATVVSALAALQIRFPTLRPYLEESDIPPTVFIGEEIAAPETPLADGAQLFLTWAMSGG